MSYEPKGYTEPAAVMGLAFVIGAVAQYIKQQIDFSHKRKSWLWVVAGAGLSSAIVIGLLLEYAKLSPPFLLSIAGIAGWAGIALLSLLANILESATEQIAKRYIKQYAPDFELEKKEDKKNGTSDSSTHQGPENVK